MTKEQAFKDINETQEFYVNELIKYLLDKNNNCFKVANFTSDTGTGKTKMISLLCNKMPEKYFVITTLSKGQLQHQIRNSLNKDIKQDNFVVYGLQDFTANTKLQANEILVKLPKDRDIIWIRDEGHINTNRWQEIINNRCWKIINFSATNKEKGIRCNFTHTMMLRTVSQQEGTPEDALDKLLEVKKQHKNVKNYNPCAIIRALDKDIEDRIINDCKERNLSYINITEESFDMSELCKDDNEYDVIINKFKIVEWVDLRRAHVLYMTNEPSNPATTIQIIGRCRRNALLYRDDIDIFEPENKKLLQNTRQCFVYYNVQNMKIATDENGNLCSTFCNKISCEQLKPNSIINVENGVMENGLTIIELKGETGEFKIDVDENTGFNIVNPQGKFYEQKIELLNQFIYINHGDKWIFQYKIKDIKEKSQIKPLQKSYNKFNYATGKNERIIEDLGPGYSLDGVDSLACIHNSGNNVWYKSSVSLGTYERIYAQELKEVFRYLIEYPTLKAIDKIDKYFPYIKIFNDKESSIIGVDLMRSIKIESRGTTWVEDKSITSKISKYSKFNSFIQNKYKNQLDEIAPYLYNGKNKFKFDKKCNSCLGYCAEYYGKYLVYGESFLKEFIIEAQKESNVDYINDYIIVRACMLMYRCMMMRAYGESVAKVIKTISVSQLIQSKYHEFVSTVIELGKNIANFVIKEFNIKNQLQPGDKLHDPNLSIDHISGLADFINKEKIIDIKCTSSITLTNIKQVLAYHYLSTKRDDLDIKEVIIFDAVNNKDVRIKL